MCSAQTAISTSSGLSLNSETNRPGKSSSAAQAAQLKHREEKKSRRKVRLTRSNCPAP